MRRAIERTLRRAIERTLRRAIIIAKWLPSMLRIERQRAEDRTITQRYFTRIGIMISRTSTYHKNANIGNNWKYPIYIYQMCDDSVN